MTFQTTRSGRAPEVHRRVLEAPVEAADPRLDGEGDIAHLEHDVGDDDGGEARARVELQEEREQRRAEDDLRGGEGQHEQQVDRRAAAKAVAAEGERDERAEDDGDAGRDRRDLEGELHRVDQRRST